MRPFGRRRGAGGQRPATHGDASASANLPDAHIRETKVRDAHGDLVLDRVTKRFGDFVAVDDLSLVVPRGSFFALLGPSGCGKTTTLRMVAGLEQPTGGRVLIGDTDLTGSRAFERPVNTVFQSYALFPHLNVHDNVAFGPRRRRVADADARADQALALVEMDHLASRRPSELSGGQQQRVAVARAIVNEPEVLLLDEPLGALDLKLRRQMQIELKRIQTEVGLTFIHVTHDQEEAMTMADTVAVMNQGRIEQMGRPAELYDLPRSAFVANFLGQANIVLARALDERADEGVAGRLHVRAAGHTFWTPSPRVADTCRPADGVPIAGRMLAWGVRPEKLRLHETDPGTPTASTTAVAGPGRLVDIGFTGVSTQYLVELPGLGTWGVFEQNMDVDPIETRVGDQVWVSWNQQHSFVVPADGMTADDNGITAVDLGESPETP